MFGSLSERLQSVFAAVRREARLTPESVETALREIRLALLEADVNFKVVRAFIDRVRDRAVDGAVLESLTPTQQVVAIVRDELRAHCDCEGVPTRTPSGCCRDAGREATHPARHGGGQGARVVCETMRAAA